MAPYEWIRRIAATGYPPVSAHRRIVIIFGRFIVLA
jgi:hypothetical protein